MEITSTIFQKVQDEDLTIFKRIKSHDENAISELYDRYALFLYSILMRMLRSVEDAENILHDVFIELWNTPEKYQGNATAFYDFLVTTTRKKALSGERSKRLKKQSHQIAQNILPVYSDYVLDHTPITPFGEEILSPLMSTFSQLSEDEQQVLALGFYEGYNQSEIAKGLSIPAWTVNWSLRKSLTALAELAGETNINSDDHHKKYLEYCAGYAVGIIDGDDKKELDSHLNQGCDICANECLKFSKVLQILPLGLPPALLSPELKERVLFSTRLSDVIKANVDTQHTVGHEFPHKLSNEVKIKSKSESPQWLYILVFALSIVLIFCVIYIWFLLRHSNNEVGKVSENSTVNFQNEIDKSNSIIKMLESRRLQLVVLDNPRGKSDEYGKLFWDPVSRIALFHFIGLPITPTEKNYQLWLLKDGQYISIVIFILEAKNKGDNLIRVQLPLDVSEKNINEFVVTLEPKGGSAEPTGQIFLQGKINR